MTRTDVDNRKPTCDGLENANPSGMSEDTMQTGPMEFDPALLRTADTVSRLAIELAKLASAKNETPEVDGAIPDAWRLLRRACLEIETEGRMSLSCAKTNASTWDRISPFSPHHASAIQAPTLRRGQRVGFSEDFLFQMDRRSS